MPTPMVTIPQEQAIGVGPAPDLEHVNRQLQAYIGQVISPHTIRQLGQQITSAMRHEFERTGNMVITQSCTSATTNGAIWEFWVQEGASTCASATQYQISLTTTGGGNIQIMGGRIWTEWNVPYRTTATATLTNEDLLWRNWVRLSPGQILVPPRVSEEERARRVAQERHWQEEEAKLQQERQEANQRAEQLLHRCLSNEQKEDLQQKGFFHLYVGEKKYRIRRGYAGNVELIDSGSDRAVHRYCIHTRDRVPDADAMLAQKLLLESNEPEFLRLANRS